MSRFTGYINYNNLKQSTHVKTLLVPLAIFLTLVPLSHLVDLYQNDDWCYYKTVENFLAGKFILHPYVGPTFYSQGFIGMIFAKLFGLIHLPVLTLFVACVALYYFILILNDYLKINLKWSIIIGLMLFFNPLSVYSLWGFMTEHYFEVFLLSGFYYFLKFDQTGKSIYLLYNFVLVFIGLLSRQVSLVLPLAIGLYYLTKRKYKLGVLHVSYFGLLYYFYSNLLPLTPRIIEVPLQFQHFLKFNYSYAVVYGSLLILTAYTLPLVINAIDLKELLSVKKKLLLYLSLAILLAVVLPRYFDPMSVSWGEFPYFENTVERTGFYPRGISGTKYHFRGNFELWRLWDFGAKIGFVLLLAYLVIKYRKALNIFSIYIVVYMGLMVVTETYYDRYIYPVLPIFIFYLLSLENNLKLYSKFILIAFIGFLLILGYQFSADYILTKRYVWHTALELSQKNYIDPDVILATNAWKSTYRKTDKEYKYVFSYDSNKINSDYRENYKLLDTYKPYYPLNLFVDPKIYLYERIK